MNIENHSSVAELTAKAAILLYGEYDETKSKTTPDRIAAAGAGYRRDPATAPDNYLVIKDVIEYALNTPVTISIDTIFIEIYYYLRTQPQDQNVGLPKLRAFAEEYSLATRIRRRKYGEEAFYAAILEYNTARDAVFDAMAAHDIEGSMDTEAQVENARCAMKKATQAVEEIRKFERQCHHDCQYIICNR